MGADGESADLRAEIEGLVREGLDRLLHDAVTADAPTPTAWRLLSLRWGSSANRLLMAPADGLSAAIGHLSSADDQVRAKALFGIDPPAPGTTLEARRRTVIKLVPNNLDHFRQAIEPRILQEMVEHITELLFAADDLEDDVTAVLADADEWFGRIVQSLAQNQFVEAIVRADRMIALLRNAPSKSLVEEGTAYLLRAHALRDLGRLGGVEGAYLSYRRAEVSFAHAGEVDRATNAVLMQAVCVEMSGHLGEARHLYAAVSARAKPGSLTGARARLWIGTTAMKQGDLNVARAEIIQGMDELARSRADRDLLTAQTKLALVEAHTGDNVRAWALLEEVRPDLTQPRDPLTQVRFELAASDVLRLMSDRDGVAEHLRRAHPLIAANEFAHQAISYQAIAQALPESTRNALSIVRVVHSFSPVQKDELVLP